MRGALVRATRKRGGHCLMREGVLLWRGGLVAGERSWRRDDDDDGDGGDDGDDGVVVAVAIAVVVAEAVRDEMTVAGEYCVRAASLLM